MKRFEFKLDGVLQLRNQHERTVIDKHAVALNRFNQLAEKMKTLREGLTMQQQRYQQSFHPRVLTLIEEGLLIMGNVRMKFREPTRGLC